MLRNNFIRHLSKLSYSVETGTTKNQNVIGDPLEVLSNPKLSYQDVFYTLHRQASNTMLLYVNANPKVDQLYLKDQVQTFCSNFGELAYFGGANKPNYFLVEFLQKKGFQELASISSEGDLTMRMAELSPKNLKMPSSTITESPNRISRLNESLKEELLNVSDLSEQIQIYFNAKRASSDCVRRNFFLPLLFQDFFNIYMKTNLTGILFGTSYSIFCSPSSDVDITLAHLSDGAGNPNASISSLNQIPASTARAYKNLQRAGTNTLFAEASKLITEKLPGVSNVSAHDALFPLISLHFMPFDTNVDITFNSRAGIQTAWVLNWFTRIDERVAPFLFLIRQWAKQSGLATHGGALYDGLTPYMVNCFALFYLMRCNPSVIPSMKQLLTYRGSRNDIIIGGFRTKLVTNCNFFKANNSSSLEDLFLGFLQYFKNFDFYNQGINLSDGKAMPSAKSTLDIRTPFDSFNVGKNCSIKSLNQFQNAIEHLLRKLEHHNKKSKGLLTFIDINSDA